MRIENHNLDGAGSSKLAAHGGRIITVDGKRTVELRDPNDNARCRFQYRRTEDGGMERRVLRENGEPFLDSGSPWEQYTDDEIARLRVMRGAYHPILDPLGL